MSGSEASAGQASDLRRCPTCGEEIWQAARKCIHCDTDFTWRRYLAFSNTTLALVTALISVVATSVPAIRLLLVADNSVITSNFVGVSPSGETLNMLFDNAGRKAGVVDRISLGIDYGDGHAFGIYPHLKDDQAITVEPGKALLATFYFKDAVLHWAPTGASADLASLGGNARRPQLNDATCRYWVRITNADGRRPTSNPATPFRCQDNAFQIFRRLLEISKSSPAQNPNAEK